MWQCGSTSRITREHVFSDWLNRVPLLPPGQSWQMFITRDGGRPPIERTSPVLDQKVGRYCQDCNTGWMSDIEGNAHQIATSLILGQRASLTPADQLALATWATLRAYVIEASQIGGERDVLATATDYVAMFVGHRPSSETLVHLARFAEPGGIYAWPCYGRGWVEGGVDLVQWSTTIVIGHLVLRVCGRDGGTPGKPSVLAPEFANLSSFDEKGVYRIWPPAPYTIQFPPPRQLTRQTIIDFASEPLPQMSTQCPDPPACTGCGTLHEDNPELASGTTPPIQ